MVGTVQFVSFKDVKQYFALRSELAPVPVPAADLWEKLDEERRKKCWQHSNSGRVLVPSAPESFKLAFSSPARRSKQYPVKRVERIQAFVVQTRAPKTRSSRPAPLSWKELL